MKKGTQVIYCPAHVQSIADFGYPNGSQPGFVMGKSNYDGDYFVRYWRIVDDKPINELRTKLNSELTSEGDLHEIATVPQSWVDQAIAAIEAGEL